MVFVNTYIFEKKQRPENVKFHEHAKLVRNQAMLLTQKLRIQFIYMKINYRKTVP